MIIENENKTYIELFSYKQFVFLLSYMLDEFLQRKESINEVDAKEFIKKIKFNLIQYEKFIEDKEKIITKFRI